MGYKFFLLVEKCLMLLPHKARKSFFAFLAFIGYKLSSKYRRVARQNLNFAFDNTLSDEEIDEITRYSFKNLLFNFLHLMEIRHMGKEDIKLRVNITNKEILDKIHSEGRAVIYATPHYCAWELGGVSLGVLAEPIAAVYKRLKNREYEEWLLGSRATFGNTNLEKTNVLKPLVKLIKEQKASAILIDTNISPKEGVIVNFMGKTIRQTATPAFLARKFNAAIVPIHIRTDDEEHYNIIVYDEIKVEKTDDEKADILKATQLQADWLSSIIKKEPKFWFWLHKRWKNDHPEIYS